MFATLSMCGRRHIEGGATIEKAVGFKGKPEVVHGHDRPILYAGDVVLTDGVPEDHVGVLNRTVGLGPGG
jgi:hypothetical protein